MTRLKVDADLLLRLGYGRLTTHQANMLLTALYETLETVVGTRLINGLSEDELDGFDEVVAEGEVAANAWLNNAAPAYRSIVRATFAELSEDLRGCADAYAAELRKER